MHLTKIGNYDNQPIVLASTVTEKKQLKEILSIPDFYQEAIIAYNKSKSQSETNFIQNISRQPLCGNEFIKHKKKTIWFKNWISSGILTVGNLMIQNGKLNPQYIYNKLSNKANFFNLTSLQS